VLERLHCIALHTAQRSPADCVLLLVILDLYTAEQGENCSSSIRRAVQDEACATSRMRLRSQERRLRDAASNSRNINDSGSSSSSSSSSAKNCRSARTALPSCAAVGTANVNRVSNTKCSSSLATLADDIHSLEQRMQSRLASLAAAAAAAGGSSSAMPTSAAKQHAAAASSSSWGLSSVNSDDTDAVRVVLRRGS
jgi:hypothetical protein